MNFDDVHLISKHIEPVPLAEVQHLETELGVKLPSGYAPFMTRFGAGTYCDLFVIYPPNRLLQENKIFQEAWKSFYYLDTEEKLHWLYEGNEHILSEAQVQECVIIGDSIDGDELIFYPPQPDKIYILPRHSQKISWVNSDFSDLHAWDRKTPHMLTFVPYHQQIGLQFRSLEYALTQTSCLEQFHGRWGSDSIIMLDDRSDAWSWRLIFFLPTVGGRIQILQDEGVTRSFRQENGIQATIQGGGRRYLHIHLNCDEESESDVRAFMQHLQTQGLVTFLGE